MRSRLALTVLCLGLAACDPGDGGPGPTRSSAAPTSAAPTTRAPGPPRAAAAVAAGVAGFTVPGMSPTPTPPGARAVVDLCPVGLSVHEAVGPTATVRRFADPRGAAQVYAATIVRRDATAAGADMGPVLDGSAACAPGAGMRVSDVRRRPVDGFPGAELLISYDRQAGSAPHVDWVGVARVDNVLVRVTWSGGSGVDAAAAGSTALRELVGRVDRAR